MSFFFFSTSLQFLSLSFGPLSLHSPTVFIWVRNHLSCIWHLGKVDGQRGEMRAEDGERQLTVSGDMHSLLFPLSYLLLHSNRLTNVPWKFTLDAGSGRSKRNEAAAERRLECDVAAMYTLFFLIQRWCWQFTHIAFRDKVKHYSRCGGLGVVLDICCTPTLSSPF